MLIFGALRRGGRLVLSATSLVIMVPLLAMPLLASATGQGNQGLQGGWAVDNSGSISFAHAVATEYPSMQQAGGGWVRINFRLGACFSDWTSVGCNGQTALETYRQVVTGAANSNLKVLGLLSNEAWNGSQSDWTANNAENAGGNGDNSYGQAFAQNAASVLAAYFNGVSAPLVSQWEVWNEPNAWTANPSPGVYTGGSFIYPSNFAWLLRRSYAAIKSANAGAVIVSGGLYAHDSSAKGRNGSYKAGKASCSSAISSGADYLCNTYSMGIADAGWAAGSYPLDQVGQHIYIDQTGTTTGKRITSYLSDLRNAYVSFEGTGTAKRTQVTEIGWTTASVAPSTQAKNLQTAFTTFRSTGYVGRGYWFNVQDLPEAGMYYGLVDTNGTPKPSFTAYQSYAAY